MLKKETITRIAAILKVAEADLTTALTAAEEVEVKIPEGLTVLTADELSNRDRTTEKRGYDKGSEASVEMLIKEQKRELGLEFEGKDPAKFLEAFKAKVLVDAKIEPSAALQEKETVITGLRANLQKLETEKNEVLSSVAKIKVESAVSRAIPANLVAGVEADEVLLTMRHKGYEFEEKEGQIVAKKGGEILADSALRPLPVQDVIKGYVTERGWLDTGAGAGKDGRGSGHSKPSTGVATKLSEAEAQWKASGKNPGTAEFQTHVKGLVKENAAFDLDN